MWLQEERTQLSRSLTSIIVKQKTHSSFYASFGLSSLVDVPVVFSAVELSVVWLLSPSHFCATPLSPGDVPLFSNGTGPFSDVITLEGLLARVRRRDGGIATLRYL
jgi:hypothetical protein